MSNAIDPFGPPPLDIERWPMSLNWKRYIGRRAWIVLTSCGGTRCEIPIDVDAAALDRLVLITTGMDVDELAVVLRDDEELAQDREEHAEWLRALRDLQLQAQAQAQAQAGENHG